MDAKQEEARSLTVAEYVAEALVSAGVTHVFGGHGGTVIPLINAICAHPNLEWIYMRNENSASLAAAAQAKLTGKLSCCVATSGPGATNLTTGLVAAAKDKVVCIVGDGAIQMTIGELIVAKQMKLKHFLVIVVNNGLLGRVHYGWEGVQGDTIDVPDFVAVAKAYGGSGARISHPEEIAPVLEEGLGHEGLYLIEVMEDPAMKAPMVSISPDVDYFA
eukprot:jgi/Pico_ML_1/55754/g1399.t1